jgi:hypothetical protein
MGTSSYLPIKTLCYLWLRCYSCRKKAVFNAGSHVYFHANSGLIVSNNASLNINGSKSNSTLFENEVVFESDRLQPEYADVPDNGGPYGLQMEAQIISTI